MKEILLEKIKQVPKWKMLVIIVLFILASISTVKGLINSQTSSIDLMWQWSKDALYEHCYNGTYFPSMMWIHFFFGLVSHNTAKIIWMLCNIAFSIMFIYTLRKTLFRVLKTDDFIILMLFMISGGPWRTNFSNGQYTICVMAFFMMAVYLSEKNRDILAGVFLAMCVFKYATTGLLAVYFLYKRKYKAVLIAIVIHIISFIGCYFWFGSIYDITIRQLNIAYQHNEKGNVDLGAVFGIGRYTAVFFAVALIIMLIMAYKLKPECDLIFISFGLFMSWLVVYQSIYCFFTLVIPLGYELYEGFYKKIKYNKCVFVLQACLTFLYFYGFTVNESAALFLVRLLFYPMVVLISIDFFSKRNKLT